MLANEILFEKPGKYDWVPDKEHSTNMPLAGRDFEFEYKGKTYKFKPVVDAAKKFGSLYRAGRGGKKDSPIRPVIKALQAYLATSGLNPGPIDGFYGEKTAKAVIQLQRKLGVTVDGDVGPNTAKAMVAKLSLPKLFMLGALISIIACGCGYSLNAEGLNVFAIVIPSMIACFGLGICVPISASCTISCFPKQGGSSAGLLGTFQFIFASIFTGLGGKVPEQTQGPMFLYLLVLMIVTLLLILPKYFRLKKNY